MAGFCREGHNYYNRFYEHTLAQASIIIIPGLGILNRALNKGSTPR